MISRRLTIYCSVTLVIMMASFAKKDTDFSSFENRTMEYLHRPSFESVITGEWFKIFESYSLDQVIGRNILVEANSRALASLGKKQVNNITISPEGTLLQVSYDFPRPETMSTDFISDVMIPFRNAVESYGGQLYYMNKYPRLLHFWDRFPYHNDEKKEDYLAENNYSMDIISDIGIHTVDTYDTMQLHSDEYLFFNTDHHYTYRGAYYSYKSLLDQINFCNPDKVPLSFPSLDSMTFVRPQGYFWGSLISQIGDTKYEGVDYLEYAVPNDYPVEYERYESGSISDMPLVRGDGACEYGWFMNGDCGNTVILTHRPELPSILIIGYSFTDALEYMAIYNFDEMHSIDPRSFNGNISEYIKKTKCDYVVVQDIISLE